MPKAKASSRKKIMAGYQPSKLELVSFKKLAEAYWDWFYSPSPLYQYLAGKVNKCKQKPGPTKSRAVSVTTRSTRTGPPRRRTRTSAPSV